MEKKNNHTKKRKIDSDCLPSLENGIITILNVIDDTYTSITFKVEYNKKFFAIKFFKTEENFNIEYNIYKYLKDNGFYEKCSNILLDYTFCKGCEYIILDNKQILSSSKLFIEYFILMDLYDGDIFTLLNDDKNFNYNETIKKFLIESIKCLYKNNFNYTDLKLENILYKIVDDEIELVFCDLGGFAHNNSYDISYTINYTCSPIIVWNIIETKVSNKKITSYTNFDYKKLMIHSLGMTLILLKYFELQDFTNITLYDTKIHFLFSMFIKQANNISYEINNEERSYVYNWYVNDMIKNINTFLINTYNVDNKLLNIIELIKKVYTMDECDFDDYVLNFIY